MGVAVSLILSLCRAWQTLLHYRILLIVFAEFGQVGDPSLNRGEAETARLTTELLSPDLAAGIRRVKGAEHLGIRLGNWLTSMQGRELLGVPDRASKRQKELRDVATFSQLLK